MEANMAKKIWTVTLADDLINSLRFDSANVLRRIIIGKGLNEAQSRQRWQAAVRPRNFLRGDENRKWRLERRDGSLAFQGRGRLEKDSG